MNSYSTSARKNQIASLNQTQRSTADRAATPVLSRSLKSWKDRADPLRISMVLIAKPLHHQLLLGFDAEIIEGDKYEHVQEAGDAILQEQRLGQDPEPLRGIHRMADHPIDTVGNELMFLPDLQGGRLVESQVRVGAPEDQNG